jgi:S1-C subfamily serine protease
MKRLFLILILSLIGCAHSVTGAGQQRVGTYELIGDSVYRIGDSESWGTGFAVKGKSGNKFIMTNDHICDDKQPTEIIYAPDGKTYKFTIVAKYSKHDLCLIRAPKNAEPLPISKKKSGFRDKIYTAGFPSIIDMTINQGYTLTVDPLIGMAYPLQADKCKGPKYKMSTGIVHGMFGPMMVPQCNMIAPRLQTSVKSGGGASGSPVVNSQGQVVGVILSVSGNLGFAQMVPLKYVRDFLNKH